jgi:hypothetical protein
MGWFSPPSSSLGTNQSPVQYRFPSWIRKDWQYLTWQVLVMILTEWGRYKNFIRLDVVALTEAAHEQWFGTNHTQSGKMGIENRPWN